MPHNNMKFLLLFVLCSVHSIKTKKNSLRIIGGRNATEHEFPFVVKLIVQWLKSSTQSSKQICSSIVLASKWTLTAAHCVKGTEQLLSSTASIPSKAVIEYNPSPKSEVAYSEVLRLTAHPSYASGTKNDIGLLQTQPVILSNYAKLSPIDYTILNGQEVFLVGYGMFKRANEDTSLLPQVLEVIVKECWDKFDVYPQICFAPPCSFPVHAEKSLCPGDSGGPAIHPSGIVGVNSFAVAADCGIALQGSSRNSRYDRGYQIGVATPVSPFIDWISSIMKIEVNT